MAQKLPPRETLRPRPNERLALSELPEAQPARRLRPAEVRTALASYLRAIRALGRARPESPGTD
jgi:hypothetical protein